MRRPSRPALEQTDQHAILCKFEHVCQQDHNILWSPGHRPTTRCGRPPGLGDRHTNPTRQRGSPMDRVSEAICWAWALCPAGVFHALAGASGWCRFRRAGGIYGANLPPRRRWARPNDTRASRISSTWADCARANCRASSAGASGSAAAARASCTALVRAARSLGHGRLGRFGVPLLAQPAVVSAGGRGSCRAAGVPLLVCPAVRALRRRCSFRWIPSSASASSRPTGSARQAEPT
jgi:hypothetical protein